MSDDLLALEIESNVRRAARAYLDSLPTAAEAAKRLSAIGQLAGGTLEDFRIGLTAATAPGAPPSRAR